MKNPAELAHGPLMIGVSFNLILYGIMIIQVYLYTTTYKHDRLWLKAFVCLLFILDTMNTVFDLVYMYNALVLHFGDIEFLFVADWVFATDPAMTAIIASIVQLFFAWRVKVITSNPFVVTVIIACALTGALCGIATSIAIGYIPQFAEFQRFKVVVIIWLVAAAFGDVIITTSLVRHLRKQKTGFSVTDDVLNRIIRLTVQTGLCTAIWAIIDLSVYLLDSTGKHLIFNFPLSKLYTNSLMSSLNSRGGWTFASSAEGNGGTSGGNKSSGMRVAEVLQMTASGPEILVTVESHEMVEMDVSRTVENKQRDASFDCKEADSEVQFRHGNPRLDCTNGWRMEKPPLSEMV